jgi:hypothetical protein
LLQQQQQQQQQQQGTQHRTLQGLELFDLSLFLKEFTYLYFLLGDNLKERFGVTCSTIFESDDIYISISVFFNYITFNIKLSIKWL